MHKRDDYETYDNGLPGEYVFGDDMYIDDYYMGELWKPLLRFPGYWVSDRGRIWSDISNSFIYGCPTGRCGHIDVSLMRNGVRHRALMHRLVAEAFIPNPKGYPLVRHLDDDPSNNCVENLAWGTQQDNMQDAIKHGRFKYFTDEDREAAMAVRRIPIIGIRYSDGEKSYYESSMEASRILGVNQTDISSVVRGEHYGTKGYYFMRQDEEFDPERYEYCKRRYAPKGRAVIGRRLGSTEVIEFGSAREAAKYLNMSESSISLALHGRQRAIKGWIFEYADEKEDY